MAIDDFECIKTMKTSVNTEAENFLFILDIITTITFFILAFWLRDVILPGHSENAQFVSHIFILPLSLALILIPLSYFGGYDPPYNTKHLTKYLLVVIKAVVLGGGIMLALLFFLKIEYISRVVIALFIVFEICSLFMIRVWSFYQYKKMVKNWRKCA